MGLFDFFKSDTDKPSVDLTDFKFLSDDHTRIENGRPTSANNKGAYRGIRVKTSDNATFSVTMYNMNENHPVWGDNIQMAEKRMKLIEENSQKIILRGFGTDAMGAPFADYGLTLHKANNIVNKVILHMHDRKIDIVYEKAENEKQTENVSQYSDFDNFLNFIQKWNSSMPMKDKMSIAIKSDKLNNKGAVAYNEDDYENAINYFEQAIRMMPNNDDALTNLRICYKATRDYDKLNDVLKKIDYLNK